MAGMLPGLQAQIGNQAALGLIGRASPRSTGGVIQRSTPLDAQDAQQDLVDASKGTRGAEAPVSPEPAAPRYQRLKKPKDLHVEPSTFSATVDTLRPGLLVQVLEMPKRRGFFSRSWAKVSTVVRGKETEGYIVTQNAETEDARAAVQPELPAAPEEVAAHNVADKNITYYGSSVSSLQDTRRLHETVTVYDEPSTGSKKLGTLVEGRLAWVKDTVPGKDGADWTRVTATLGGEKRKGYVKFKNKSKGEETPLTYGQAGQIMDPAGPTLDDIAQNMFGDCFLLAALMSLVRRDPKFIRDKLFVSDPTRPAATHTLRFYARDGHDQAYHEERVTVGNTVLQIRKDTVMSNNVKVRAGTNYGSKGAWNWPTIVEKAYQAWPTKTELGGSTSLEGGNSHITLGHLTGKPYADASLYALTEDAGEGVDVSEFKPGNKEAIIAASQSGMVMTVGTRRFPSDAWKQRNKDAGKGGSGEMKVGGIAFKHAYELVSADQNKVVMRNPWGRFARVNGKVVENAAETVLSWAEFREVAEQVVLEKDTKDRLDLRQ